MTASKKFETRLLEALSKIDAYGDVAPPDVHDPMVMILRQKALQADLVRWDADRARYVLTGTGRHRITARNRTPGQVVHFERRSPPTRSRS